MTKSTAAHRVSWQLVPRSFAVVERRSHCFWPIEENDLTNT